MLSVKKAAWILFAPLLLIACGDDDSGSDHPDFDRQAMLRHFTDRLIKPAYTDFQASLLGLKSATEAFAASPDTAKLEAAQAAWGLAYDNWTYANAYNFGPGGEEGIRKSLVEEIGIFPVNTDAIEANIAANDTNFNNFERESRGLNTVDYLLFGTIAQNADVVAAFENDPNRGAYLLAVVAKVVMQVDEVMAAWNGSYPAAFIANDGTDVGSSTSQFYNEFVKSYESIKNFKVGVPLGKRTGQTMTEPTKVEARYSGQSLRFIRSHLRAIDDIWHGRDKSGMDGTGWREYLDATVGGDSLIARTEARMGAIWTALDQVPETPNFEQLILENHPSLPALHDQLQAHTRNYKSDMSSLLGIAITFSSGDGD